MDTRWYRVEFHPADSASDFTVPYRAIRFHSGRPDNTFLTHGEAVAAVRELKDSEDDWEWIVYVIDMRPIDLEGEL